MMAAYATRNQSLAGNTLAASQALCCRITTAAAPGGPQDPR